MALDGQFAASWWSFYKVTSVRNQRQSSCEHWEAKSLDPAFIRLCSKPSCCHSTWLFLYRYHRCGDMEQSPSQQIQFMGLSAGKGRAFLCGQQAELQGASSNELSFSFLWSFFNEQLLLPSSLLTPLQHLQEVNDRARQIQGSAHTLGVTKCFLLLKLRCIYSPAFYLSNEDNYPLSEQYDPLVLRHHFQRCRRCFPAGG